MRCFLLYIESHRPNSLDFQILLEMGPVVCILTTKVYITLFHRRLFELFGVLTKLLWKLATFLFITYKWNILGMEPTESERCQNLNKVGVMFFFHYHEVFWLLHVIKLWTFNVTMKIFINHYLQCVKCGTLYNPLYWFAFHIHVITLIAQITQNPTLNNIQTMFKSYLIVSFFRLYRNWTLQHFKMSLS